MNDRHTEVARLISAGAVLLLACLAFFMIRALPPQHSPFADLDLERPIGAATALQFDEIREEPNACSAALAASNIEVAMVEERREGACGLINAVTLMRTHYPYSTPVTVSCPVAAALYVWEREVVQPAAAQLESPVARIEVIGTYACRNIYGQATGRLSEHARGNAIDISGFRLENGRTISVREGWTEGGADAAFLRSVRDGACRAFQVVLSPDYNQAHHDHFHFDMASYSVCS